MPDVSDGTVWYTARINWQDQTVRSLGRSQLLTCDGSSILQMGFTGLGGAHGRTREACVAWYSQTSPQLDETNRKGQIEERDVRSMNSVTWKQEFREH